MRTNRRNMTEAEHQEMGKQLHDTRSYLVGLVSRVSSAYGNTAKVAKLTWKALQVVDKLRCQMENHYFQDCPTTADTRVYYRQHRLSMGTQQTGG